METILGAVLDISRLDAGALKPEETTFRLDGLLKQIGTDFRPMAEIVQGRLAGIRLGGIQWYYPVGAGLPRDQDRAGWHRLHRYRGASPLSRTAPCTGKAESIEPESDAERSPAQRRIAQA